MATHIGRREFIATLGGAAAWPLAARAQQGERVRRIGLLMGTADDREGQARVTALKQGLQELGWTDGGNIQIETRFSGADAGRIWSQAAELERIPLRFEHSLHGERSSCTLLPRNRQRSVRSGAIDAEWCARRPCAGQPSLC
jgi:hypothetical protein